MQQYFQARIFFVFYYSNLYWFYENKEKVWGHLHSTYTQKSPKLDPLPPHLYAIVHIRLDPLYAYILSIYSHPLLINFYSDSSFRHSQFPGYFRFYLSLRLNFTKLISKKISMVSIQGLRLADTFLYTIINGSVRASFVPKKKRFKIFWSKKKFFCGRRQP